METNKSNKNKRGRKIKERTNLAAQPAAAAQWQPIRQTPPAQLVPLARYPSTHGAVALYFFSVALLSAGTLTESSKEQVAVSAVSRVTLQSPFLSSPEASQNPIFLPILPRTPPPPCPDRRLLWRPSERVARSLVPAPVLKVPSE